MAAAVHGPLADTLGQNHERFIINTDAAHAWRLSSRSLNGILAKAPVAGRHSSRSMSQRRKQINAAVWGFGSNPADELSRANRQLVSPVMKSSSNRGQEMHRISSDPIFAAENLLGTAGKGTTFAIGIKPDETRSFALREGRHS